MHLIPLTLINHPPQTLTMADSVAPNLSRRAAKKARRKQEKTEKKRQALDDYLKDANNNGNRVVGHDDANDNKGTSSSSVGGKASRARIAREKDNDITASFQSRGSSSSDKQSSYEQHRPQGGAPILSQILPQHRPIVECLERKEQEMRIKGRGMKERMKVVVDCHGSMDSSKKCDAGSQQTKDGYYDLARYRARGIVSLASLSSLPEPPKASKLSTIQHLDLSRNELWDISVGALQSLSSTLTTLDISRNWFESLPESIGVLTELTELRASHNLLKPNDTKSLRVDVMKKMKSLQIIDLRFNQKCGKRTLMESLQSTLGHKVDIQMTITYPPPPPETSSDSMDRVGESPAVRDAKLLRSQLEPWSTMALRRRLVSDFGQEHTSDGRSWADPDVLRGNVMDRLLLLYQEEASDKNNTQVYNVDDNGRAVVHVSGVRADQSICDRVLDAMKELWSTAPIGSRERPSIRAEDYMILCSPTMFEATSQKAAKAACKLKKYQALWDLAYEAMHSVDPVYASQYTAVAVTHNFVGSPHLDKQNTGPFYGFAVGSFEEGSGCIMVECSARVTAAINTKNRFGKCDGRFPHWVAPYDGDRYSLIYYRTEGCADSIGPSVFAVPSDQREG